jgi:Cu-Zn family superoxide dismutase
MNTHQVMDRIAAATVLAAALLVAAGTAMAEHHEGDAGHAGHHAEAAAATPAKAIARLMPTAGSKVSGIVRFEQTAEGVLVSAMVAGLEPDSSHGFHIHEYGNCIADDGTSAGGHFNPHGVDHAGPDADTRHAGDLGNLAADSSGKASYERVDRHLALSGPDSIIGRGIIVHADTDDLKTQPTGGAGARKACGVIGVTN